MIAKYPDMKIIKSQTGDFTRAKGKEVMEAFLKSPEGNQITALYAHNDDMALRRHPGDRGGRQEAGQGHPDSVHRWRERRVRGDGGRASSTAPWSATR